MQSPAIMWIKLCAALLAVLTFGGSQETCTDVQFLSPSEAADTEGNVTPSEFDAIPFRIPWSYPAVDFGANNGFVTPFAARPDEQVEQPQSSFCQHVGFRHPTTVRFGDFALVNDGGVPAPAIHWVCEDVNHDNRMSLSLKFRVSEMLESWDRLVSPDF